MPGEEDAVPAIPGVIDPASPADYLRVMARAVFQAGVSWKQIAARWMAYERAFDAFDPQRVAAYGEADVERVLDTPGVMRTRRKVLATIDNAKALLALESEFGGVAGYLRSHATYPALVKDFRKRFAFMGEMNVWYFLFRVGEPVPRFESWVATIDGDHPRMREMVELARGAGRSSEY